MKNKVIYHVALALLAGGVFASCTREVEDIFDVPGAQRLQEAMTEIEQTLVAAPNGWEMRYYTQPETAGYVMLIKFDANGRVTVAAKNAATTSNRYTSAVSTWEVIGDNGPVITFNSYNDVLHAFSDPQNDGVGLGGDYEFMVVDWADANHLRLKGKKAEAYIDMYALDPAQGWEDYYAKVDALNALVFLNNDGVVFNFSSEDGVREIEYGHQLFNFLDETEYYGMIVLPTGIEFYSGIPVGASVARHFEVNEDATALICTDDGIDATFTAGETAAEYCVSYMNGGRQRSWELNLDNLEGSAKTAYDNFVDAMGNVTVKSIVLNTSDTISSYLYAVTFRLNGVEYVGHWYGDVQGTENAVQFVYEDADATGRSLFARAGKQNEEAGRALIMDALLEKKMTVKSNVSGTLNYSVLRFTDETDAGCSFTMAKR